MSQCPLRQARRQLPRVHPARVNQPVA